MGKPTYFNAVQKVTDNKARHGHADGPISKIHLADGTTPPTEEAIQEKLDELQADYDAKRYQRDRKYPPIGDQLDEIYHKGIDEWKKTIKAVKDAHPKPE